MSRQTGRRGNAERLKATAVSANETPCHNLYSGCRSWMATLSGLQHSAVKPEVNTGSDVLPRVKANHHAVPTDKIH